MSPDLGETIAFGMIAAVLLGSGLASSMVKRTFHAVMFLGVVLVAAASLYILLGSPLVGVIQILVYVGGILTLFVFAVMFVAGDDEGEGPAYAPAPRSTAWGKLAGVFMGLTVVAWIFGAGPKMLPSVFDIYEKAANVVGGHGVWQGQGAGFTAAIVYMVVLAVAGIVIWMGLRHAIYAWSPSRLIGIVIAAVILGSMVGIAMSTQWGPGAASDASQTRANDLDGLVATLFGPQVVALEILGVLLTAAMVGALVIARPLTGVADKDRYPTTTHAQLVESQDSSDPALHPVTEVDA